MRNPFRRKLKGDLIGTSPSGKVSVTMCAHLSAFQIKTPYTNILGHMDNVQTIDSDELYAALQQAQRDAKEKNDDVVVAELTKFLVGFGELVGVKVKD